MATSTAPTAPERLRLRLTLQDVVPEIRREIEADADLPLNSLHHTIQVLMGWRGLHAHEFGDVDPEDLGGDSRRQRWGVADADDPDVLDEDTVDVDEALTGGTLWYEYDFGDGWTVRIDEVARTPRTGAVARVLVLDGERRGPWEDSGGPFGYQEKLRVLADQAHPEHLELREWLDLTVGPWCPVRPDYFDLAGCQAELNLFLDPIDAGLDPGDRSGLLRPQEHGENWAPSRSSALVDFVAAMPAPIRSELRMHLHRRRVLERMADWTEQDDAAAERLTRPYRVLLQAIGHDGVELTQAGWLPTAVVAQVADELGWGVEIMGSSPRESSTPSVMILRYHARRMGLVRKYRGRLLPTSAARKIAADPRLLLEHVGAHVHDGLEDAERFASVAYLLAVADGTPAALRWRSARFALDMLGWARSDGSDFEEPDIAEIVGEVDEVLDLPSRLSRTDEDQEDRRAFARAALR